MAKQEGILALVKRRIYWKLWFWAYRANLPFYIRHDLYQKSIPEHERERRDSEAKRMRDLEFDLKRMTMKYEGLKMFVERHHDIDVDHMLR